MHRCCARDMRAGLSWRARPAAQNPRSSCRGCSTAWTLESSRAAQSNGSAQMHAPTGLDLGAETPAAIALSIIAEIQQTLNNGSALPLRQVRAVHPADEPDLNETQAASSFRCASRTSRNFASHAGCAVHAGPVTSLPSTIASAKSSETNVPPARVTSGAHAG